MADIAQRLRSLVDVTDSIVVCEALEEAADEIERLRNQLWHLRDQVAEKDAAAIIKGA